MQAHTCCFFGHRKIDDTEELKSKLCGAVEGLIVENRVDTFLFGSKSQFNDLCYDIVTKLKEKHPHIKRIYVRAEYPWINEIYESFLLESYEHTYYPEKIIGAGKAIYVRRNYEMIDKSQYCVVYYHQDKIPATRKSGTEIALNYAMKMKREIIMI